MNMKVSQLSTSPREGHMHITTPTIGIAMNLKRIKKSSAAAE
jgi:hypothetical protein